MVTLRHELVQAAGRRGHRKDFRALAVQVGLAGPMILGALAWKRSWCYMEWAALLRDLPEHRRLVFDVFSRYPESGLAEALRGG